MKWEELLERLNVSKIILADLPIYSQDGSEEILPKPSWRTCLYLLDGDTKPVPREELDKEEVQWVTRQNRGCRKAKMLSQFADHPEVKWEEREPVVNAPTLDVESDREGEERPVQQIREGTSGIQVCHLFRFMTPRGTNQ